MARKLIGSVPFADDVPPDDPQVAAHFLRCASIAASARSAEVLTVPVHVDSFEDPRYPGWVTHTFECMTTDPVLD